MLDPSSRPGSGHGAFEKDPRSVASCVSKDPTSCDGPLVGCRDRKTSKPTDGPFATGDTAGEIRRPACARELDTAKTSIRRAKGAIVSLGCVVCWMDPLYYFVPFVLSKGGVYMGEF